MTATDGLGLFGGFGIVDLVHLCVDVGLHVLAVGAADPFDQSRDHVQVVLFGILEPESIADANAHDEQDDVFQHTLATRRGRGR